VIIGSSVTRIGDYAFQSCTALTGVTLPNSVTSIGSHAFQYCSGLTSMTLPNSITTIGDYAFQSCTGLFSVTIGNGVTNIGLQAFSECSSLTSLIIPASITYIGDEAFRGCIGLTEIYFEGNAPVVGTDIFAECINLTIYILPSTSGWPPVPGLWAGRPTAHGGTTRMRIVASNLTSGKFQKYETEGLNILKGLRPDIVAVQEFNYGNSSNDDIRVMVDEAFGPQFYYYREPYRGNYPIPNGVISRWPIVEAGYWEDPNPNLNQRGFVWSQIDIPGENDLFVVSIHFKASSGLTNEAQRALESEILKSLIMSNFPASSLIIVAGDFNLHSDDEYAYTNLLTFLSDSPTPVDNHGNRNTNAKRVSWYDHVLFSSNMAPMLTAVEMPSQSFANGLVFDSRVYTPLSDAPPVTIGDSAVTNMQHMAVVRDYRFTHTKTVDILPPTITEQPSDLRVDQSAPATFSVAASGGDPLAYRWQKYGLYIAGMTNRQLHFDNVQPADLGQYRAIVANAMGVVTSETVMLNLVVPAPEISIISPTELAWIGLSNLNYSVQGCTNLTLGVWTNITTTQSPSGSLIYSHPAITNDKQFIRIIYP
jgi:endonuclease/exonuclease/phosphatase family metal-dependent hydrolase